MTQVTDKHQRSQTWRWLRSLNDSVYSICQPFFSFFVSCLILLIIFSSSSLCCFLLSTSSMKTLSLLCHHNCQRNRQSLEDSVNDMVNSCIVSSTENLKKRPFYLFFWIKYKQSIINIFVVFHSIDFCVVAITLAYQHLAGA